MNVKKPYVVIKGADVSEFRFGARAYVMVFYPNRHLFLLYDFTDGFPLAEPVQIKAPTGIQNYLLLQDKRIATFSKNGTLDIWYITDNGGMKLSESFTIYKKQYNGLQMVESKDGSKLLCQGYRFVAVCDLKRKRFLKYEITNQNYPILLDQGDIVYLVELDEATIFLYELGPNGEKSHSLDQVRVR